MTDTPTDALHVKRFSACYDGRMQRSSEGEYVFFEDYLAEVTRLTDELEEQVDRIEELEAACEVVSSEFEGELWRVCRQLLEKTGFDIRAYEPDGIQAEAFEEHMNDVLLERDTLRAQVQAADGCATWCECLIEMVQNTSCASEDPDAFDEVLMGAITFTANYRAARGDT